jgi:hypothetical protein
MIEMAVDVLSRDVWKQDVSIDAIRVDLKHAPRQVQLVGAAYRPLHVMELVAKSCVRIIKAKSGTQIDVLTFKALATMRNGL